MQRFAWALFRAATWSFPRSFRDAHAREMHSAFSRELEGLSDRGAGAVLVYALRASGDALKQGLKERARRGVPRGHGSREPGRGRMMEGVWTDVRLALRGLRRAPGFAFAAIAVLALGVGANTTVFSALKMAVLAPPPYPEPERLAIADLVYEHTGRGERDHMAWSYPKFQTFLEAEGRLIAPAAGYANRSATLTGAGDPTVLNLEVISPGYFEILGLDPVVGRAFASDEGDAAAPPMVVVLGHELWRTRFSGDASVLDREITLNGKPLQVVGVAPEGFEGLTGGASLWLPMAASAEIFNRFMIRGAQAHWFHVVGRLTDGASIEEAGAQMASIGDGIAEAFPSNDPQSVFSGTARSFEDVRINAGARASVLIMSAAALLVLLVACANLSGLLIARVRRRARDGAVRAAIGASRWRLIRASLVESSVLATLGGAAGLLVALWGTRAMQAAWPRRFLGSGNGEMRVMHVSDLTVDPAVLAFAFGITLVTALLFGLGPAVRMAWSDVSACLKDGGAATRRGSRLLGLDSRAMLVGTQVALALVLLIGAGLIGASTKRLLEVDEGFRTDNLVTFTYAIPASSSRAENPASFHQDFLDRVEALPEVETATIGCAPLRGHCWITRVDHIEGEPEIPQGEGAMIGIRTVGDHHFEKLGIPVLRGRTLDEQDGTDPSTTVVISRFAADELFSGSDPLGRRIKVGVSEEGKDEYAEIVGVVGDVLYSPPDQDVMAEAYYSFREFQDRIGNITVRTAGDPMVAMPAIRNTMLELDPALALYRIETMDELITRSIGDRTVILALLTIFAWVTLLLAGTGTWGIVSYSIADRRRELGLRIALGAGDKRVLRLVLSQTVRTAFVGVGLGLLGGAFGTRLLEAFLWQTPARDPVTFGAGAALLLAVVAFASYVPARRATLIDPVEALRAE